MIRSNSILIIIILILSSIIFVGCAPSSQNNSEEVHLFNKFKQYYNGEKVTYEGSPVYNENDSHYYVYEEDVDGTVYVTRINLPPSHKNLYCDYCKMKGTLRYNDNLSLYYLDVETVLFREKHD